MPDKSTIARKITREYSATGSKFMVQVASSTTSPKVIALILRDMAQGTSSAAGNLTTTLTRQELRGLLTDLQELMRQLNADEAAEAAPGETE